METVIFIKKKREYFVKSASGIQEEKNDSKQRSKN
jgi:hypothetical protein